MPPGQFVCLTVGLNPKQRGRGVRVYMPQDAEDLKTVDSLEEYIRAGRLETAATAMRLKSVSELEKMLSDLCSGGEQSLGIAVYGALVQLLRERDTDPELHLLAVSLLVNDLVWLSGAYSLALYHARRAATLRPNDVELMEQVLFFDCVPDPPLPADEAHAVAQRLLAMQPDNAIGREVMSRARWKSQRPPD